MHYLRNTGSPWIRRYWDGTERKRSVLYSHTNENLHSLPVLFVVLEAVVPDVERGVTRRRGDRNTYRKRIFL